MPIVNGAYVAPTWNNDAPPAINAAELQDICDTIETYSTTKADVSYVNTFVRPNLLDNAYFAGGGSQQGGGQFPINQRGSTSKTTTGYFIDRWKNTTGNGSVSLTPAGLSLVGGGSSWCFLDQVIEFSQKLFGQKVTLSFINSAGDLLHGTYTLPTSFPTSDTNYMSVEWLGNIAFSLRGNSSYFYCRFAVQSASSTPIVAVKLELGDTQTLAHWDEAAQEWVLNEVPNYQQELAKCQRTVVPLGNFERIRASRVVGSVINFFVPTPVSMRGAGTTTLIPSLSDQNNIIKIYDMNNNQLTGFTFSVAACSYNGVTIAASKTNHGITDAYIQFESNTYNAFLVNDL